MFLFVRQSFIKQNPHEKAATMQVTGAEEDLNSTEVLISREGGGEGGGRESSLLSLGKSPRENLCCKSRINC